LNNFQTLVKPNILINYTQELLNDINHHSHDRFMSCFHPETSKINTSIKDMEQIFHFRFIATLHLQNLFSYSSG
jgi:hypothetical protein